MRERCSLSPLLFNILIAEVMGKAKWEGVRLLGERVYTLSYVDDMILLTEEEEEMKSIMEKLEEYLDRKGLELNAVRRK